MHSLTETATNEIDDYYADVFIGKAYCAGIKSMRFVIN